METLGLTVALPSNADAVEDAIGGNTIGRIRDLATTTEKDGKAQSTWTIEIQRRRSADTTLELKAVADAALTQLMETFGMKVVKDGDLLSQPTWTPGPQLRSEQGRTVSVASVMLREPASGKELTIRNEGRTLPAERFYVRMPSMNPDEAGVRGVTFVQIAPGEFLTFDLVTDASTIERARPIYEMIVASAMIADQAAEATQRASSIVAGEKILAQFSTEKMESLIAEHGERWERIYRPSKSGKQSEDEEVGYRRISMSYAPRRSMPGSKATGVAGATKGYIVRIDARFLDGLRIIDSQSAFFMTPDRTEESWSVAMTIREGATQMTHTEVGVRSGQDMKITITSDNGSNARTIAPQVPSSGYISRVESFLLPALLVRGEIPTIYGFYAYQSQSERIQYRKDVLERPSGNSTSWTLRTRLAEGQPEQASEHDTKGWLVRTRLPTGLVSEPTTSKDLLRLWESKKLPVQ